MNRLSNSLDSVIFVRDQLEVYLERIRSWVVQNVKFRNSRSFTLAKGKLVLRGINCNTDIQVAIQQ